MQNPVLTTIDTMSLPISEVQYPTVTVCSDGGYDPWEFHHVAYNKFKVCNNYSSLNKNNR